MPPQTRTKPNPDTTYAPQAGCTYTTLPTAPTTPGVVAKETVAAALKDALAAAGLTEEEAKQELSPQSHMRQGFFGGLLSKHVPSSATASTAAAGQPASVSVAAASPAAAGGAQQANLDPLAITHKVWEG